MKKPVGRKSRIPRDAVVKFKETPHIPGVDDYELPPQLEVDYRRAKPNRFAGQVRFTRGGARTGAGRKPSPEPLIAKKVYLYPRHLKVLVKIDKNLSAAIRKLADAQAKSK